MKKTKKILYATLLLSSVLSQVVAEDGENTPELKDAIEARKKLNASIGNVLQNEEEVTSGDGKTKLEDPMYDTVIYNDIYNKRSNRNQDHLVIDTPLQSIKKSKIYLSHRDTYLSEMEAIRKKQFAQYQEKLNEEKNKVLEKPKYFVGGYCIAMQRTEIVKASSFGSFDCELNFGSGHYREVQIFAGIYPDYQRELAIAIPIYATMPNGERMEMSGIAMNINKTSLNIANEVESYKMRRWVAKYGLAVNDVAYKYASMYLADKRASQTDSQIDYISSEDGTTTVPVQTVTTQAPSASDYFGAFGIELASRLFAIGAENLLEDTSPLFTIYKGQRIWVEGVIDTDNSKIFGTLKKIGDTKLEEIRNNNMQFNQEQQVASTPSSTQVSATTSTTTQVSTTK